MAKLLLRDIREMPGLLGVHTMQVVESTNQVDSEVPLVLEQLMKRRGVLLTAFTVGFLEAV